MIRLTNATTDLLRVTPSGADAVKAVVSYSDKTATAYTGGTQVTAIAAASITTICGTPGASTIRDIDHVTLYCAIANTLSVGVTVSATEYMLIVAALSAGDTLEYTHAHGWRVIDSNGSMRVVFGNVTGNLAVGGTLAVTGATTLTGDLAVNGGDLTSTASTFNLLAANATTVNAFGAASVALNIGNASAAAAFPGGITIAASKSVTGTVASSTITGFLSVAATTGTFTNIGGTLSTAAQPNVTSVGTLTSVTSSGVATLGGAASPILINRLSDATTFGAISFNNVITNAGILGIVGISGGALQLRAPTGGSFSFSINAATASFAVADNIGLAATKKLYLDGVAMTGDTYITETSANVMDLYAGAAKTLSLNATGASVTGTLSTTDGVLLGGATALNYMRHQISNTFTSGGASTLAVGTYFSGTITGAAGDTTLLAAWDLGSVITTQTATESVGIVTQLYLNEPGITNNLTGGGVITNASTLYIANAPTEGATNSAIYVAAGAVMFKGAHSNTIGGTGSTSSVLTLPASTTGVSSLRIAAGTAPSSPVAGDIWTDGTHIYWRSTGGSSLQLDN